jgi:hypothetical protein
MNNEFGVKAEEMFAGIEEPRIETKLVSEADVKEVRKTYREKLVEALLHWEEELRNYREMKTDFELIPAEAREKADKAEKEMRHIREDKQKHEFSKLSEAERKAFNYVRSLPNKQMEVLKAKRAVSHIENVLHDLKALESEKYGALGK